MQRIKKTILCFVIPIFVLAITPHSYAGDREQFALRTLLGNEAVRQEMFAPSFLAQVPITQIQAFASQIRSTIGVPIEILEQGADYLIKTETHELPATIRLDDSGKIVGLLFRTATLIGQESSKIIAKMNELGGDIAYLVIKGGETLHQQKAHKKLAVGSAFKLGILAALADKISAGDASWDDVVKLKPDQISLPSGMLQKFPIGSPITLHTLAALMISISDNTATDVLLDFVGRDLVAAKLDVDFVLKTREFFMLKADKKLRENFLSGDIAAKKNLASEIARLPQPNPDKASVHHNEGVEFYISLTRLCTLMSEVSKLDVMSINPGVANPKDWQRVTYKGGSEQGVLNFTTQVTDKAGVDSCVAFTWNADQTLDEIMAGSLVSALIKNLH